MPDQISIIKTLTISLNQVHLLANTLISNNNNNNSKWELLPMDCKMAAQLSKIAPSNNNLAHPNKMKTSDACKTSADHSTATLKPSSAPSKTSICSQTLPLRAKPWACPHPTYQASSVKSPSASRDSQSQSKDLCRSSRFRLKVQDWVQSSRPRRTNLTSWKWVKSRCTRTWKTCKKLMKRVYRSICKSRRRLISSRVC